eukprot:scaffold53366_cov29-Prasinocladus_malaysianus.AAC.1
MYPGQAVETAVQPDETTNDPQPDEHAAGGFADQSHKEEDEDGEAMAREQLRYPEVQVFAEFVLESALYGLVQESAADEWTPLNGDDLPAI